jgi:hypothetical protein
LWAVEHILFDYQIITRETPMKLAEPLGAKVVEDILFCDHHQRAVISQSSQM